MFDVCVVGSGPVGLSLAVDLTSRGLRVIVFEAGGRQPRADDDGLEFGSVTTPQNHAPTTDAVCRALGGTSWNWGGRCVPLDDLDFSARPYVRQGRWPIEHAQVSRYYDRAADLVGCGGSSFSADALPGTAGGTGFSADRLERWCTEPRIGRRLIARARPGFLHIVVDTTVTGFRFAPDLARVAALTIHSGGRSAEFAGAGCFVIAGGGLQTARLLLNAQCENPGLFGGADGHLGRHYMGHLSGRIATIRFANRPTARAFGYRLGNGAASRRRFALDAAVHEAHQLPNIAFWPDNPPMHDPVHRSGLLSALYLGLSLPVAGRRLMAGPIRKSQIGEGGGTARHLRNIICDLPQTATGLADVVRQRFVHRRRIPALLVDRRDGQYPLHFHAEHMPNASSAVRLAGTADRTGMRSLSVALDFTASDGRGVVDAHKALARGLNNSGLGRLKFEGDEDDLPNKAVAGSMDGYHQIGLARMGASPGDGVVDSDCRIFGISNLFVAGSAVFRTSGQANPTFPAIALALRLSAHLEAVFARTPAVRTCGP